MARDPIDILAARVAALEETVTDLVTLLLGDLPDDFGPFEPAERVQMQSVEELRARHELLSRVATNRAGFRTR